MGKSLIIKGADFSEIAIPKEYVVLDWIANSNGDTKFDMGFKPNLSKRFELDFSVTSAFINTIPSQTSRKVAVFGCTNGYGDFGSVSGMVMGVRKHTTTASINNTICCIFSSDYFGGTNPVGAGENGKLSDTNKHVLSVCATEILLDGVQAMNAQPVGGSLETALSNNLCVCGIGGLDSTRLAPVDSSDTTTFGFTDQIHTHGLRVFDNKTDTTPSMNFIPVKKTEDGKPYFYDTVNAVYVPASNDGSGVIYALNGTIYNYDGSEYSE